MIEILKPIEVFMGDHLSQGILREIVFQILRSAHLFFSIYSDYMLFFFCAVLPYYLIPRKLRIAYLTLTSLVLITYIYGLIVGLGLLILPLIGHYLVVICHKRALSDPVFRKKAIGGLVSITLLIYGLLLARESYKWDWSLNLGYDGFIEAGLHFCGVAYMLPRIIHYMVDTLTGKLEPAKSIRFVLYMIFFPTLRLGPIERYQNFSRDMDSIEKGGPSWHDIGYGAWRIALGFSKLAFYGYVLIPWSVENTTHDIIRQHSWFLLYWTIASCVFGVYLNFGGYSDIAIGFSRLLGFTIMENFYRPFSSRNIGDWWRRWHISLSFWLRDYVYMALGGKKGNKHFNLLVTFFICGAWHALTLNYVIWGVAQAIGMIGLDYWRSFWKRVGTPGYADWLKPLVALMRAHPVFSHFLASFTTFNYFCVTGIFFIFDVDKGSLFFLRFITFGLYKGIGW